jgi:hypothetical protein
MRTRKKPSVAFVTVISSLALVFLIWLRNVVPVDWVQTHQAIRLLAVLMPLQPILAWSHRLRDEQKD